MAKGKVELTLTDVIATLKNSSIPNVVVEGKDDIVIFRRLEHILSDHSVSVLPVGGQDKVLEIFRRRKEFAGSDNVAFVADRDSWVYKAIPQEYIDKSLVFTDGYSIENDAVRDGDLLNLMSPGEKKQFLNDLEIIIKWFALAISRFIDGYPEPLSIYPTVILDIENVDELVSDMIRDDIASQYMYGLVRAEPMRLLRGKTLLSLIMMQLTYKNRVVHHQHLSLLDMVGAKPGDLISALFRDIQTALNL